MSDTLSTTEEIIGFILGDDSDFGWLCSHDFALLGIRLVYRKKESALLQAREVAEYWASRIVGPRPQDYRIEFVHPSSGVYYNQFRKQIVDYEVLGENCVLVQISWRVRQVEKVSQVKTLIVDGVTYESKEPSRENPLSEWTPLYDKEGRLTTSTYRVYVYPKKITFAE